MEIQRQSYFLRSHLLSMAMLSQRAVNYCIKAHELGASEIYRLFWKNDQEWRNLQRCIGDRGRTLFASGTPVDAESTAGDCALRIYSALYVTYTAACEIAHIGSLLVEGELKTASPRVGDIARFINSLVRLYTVALFKKEVQHSRTILRDHQGWRSFELALCHTHLLVQNPGPQARLDLAVARALSQIAEQAYEIAQASTLWLDGDNSLGSASEDHVSHSRSRETLCSSN
jgi:hypothetical protein